MTFIKQGYEKNGTWVDDAFEGYGIQAWDGTGEGVNGQVGPCIYRGQFKDDERSGYGVMIFRDGTKVEGNWKANHPVPK